jgi:hypothetical protein
VTDDSPNPTTPEDQPEASLPSPAQLSPSPAPALDAAPAATPGSPVRSASPVRPASSADVGAHRPEYKGAELDPERGPGLGCFWFQLIILGIFFVLIPIGITLAWPFEVLAILLFVVIGLLLLTGQSVIFLLRLVAADRRSQGRRRPLASPTKTVGEMEDDQQAAPAVAGGRQVGASPAAGADAAVAGVAESPTTGTAAAVAASGPAPAEDDAESIIRARAPGSPLGGRPADADVAVELPAADADVAVELPAADAEGPAASQPEDVGAASQRARSRLEDMTEAPAQESSTASRQAGAAGAPEGAPDATGEDTAPEEHRTVVANATPEPAATPEPDATGEPPANATLEPSASPEDPDLGVRQ